MLQNAYWMPTFSVLHRSTTIGSKFHMLDVHRFLVVGCSR
ncbi:hypothetical protein ABIC09_006396 [Bradyrhizobium sp. S3.12.5]